MGRHARVGGGSYDSDKLPVIVLADRRTGQQYVISVADSDESTILLLLADCKRELLTVNIDQFRAYEFLEE